MSVQLVCESISKSFGGVRALQDVSVDLVRDPMAAKGSLIVAVVGANGSGKSTLLDIMSGMVTPDTGNVRLNGQVLRGQSASAVARRGIARSFQRPRVVERLSALDNVLLGFRASADGSLLRWTWPWAHSPTVRDAVGSSHALLEAVGLSRVAHRLTGELSYGQRRLLEIARAVADQPAVLLLDEPTAGVDAEAVASVAQVIANERKRGALIVVVEHDMCFVNLLAERVVELSEGRIVNDRLVHQDSRSRS